MNRISFVKILMILLLAGTRQLVIGQNQSFVADTDRFGVRLFLVPDGDAFQEMWSRSETPRLTVFNQVPTNSQFAAVILYWGGGIDANGECNIQLQMQVLEGESVIASGSEMPVCQNKPPANPELLVLSDTIIDLFASVEPASLVVKVNVTDKANNETVSVNAPIEVLAKKHLPLLM